MQQSRFENFPSRPDDNQDDVAPPRLQFKLEPDMPFSFSGDARTDIEQKQPPLVRFKNAEDLRYQNDYFEIPSQDNFDFENEIFQDFEVPKLNPKKPQKLQREFLPKPAKLIQYSEPISHKNALDIHHKDSDVETFQVPSHYQSYEDKMPYAHLKSSPHYVDFDKGPSVDEPPFTATTPRATYSIAPRLSSPSNYKDFHQKVEDTFRDVKTRTGYKSPKLGSNRKFDEHVFRLPDAPENVYDRRENDYDANDYRRENHDVNQNWPVDHSGPRNDFMARRPGLKSKLGDYNDYYGGDYAEYNDDYNEVDDYPEYQYPASPRQPAAPAAPRQPAAVPAPLPPPPAIIEMQHDSVFAGNFDVPKLGVATEYKPPELVYNEMFLDNNINTGRNYGRGEKNSFSNLLPRKQSREMPEKLSRSLTATPSPFLPTPSKALKPLADYSHLYRQQQRAEADPVQLPPYSGGRGGDTHRDYFKPTHSPSLTFEEPEISNDIGGFGPEDRLLYEKLHGGDSYDDGFLHNIVEDNLDYSQFRSQEPPIRPETVVPPASSSLQRSDFSVEGLPRPKRYQSVDYTPQEPYYDYQPRRIPTPYPKEPYVPYSGTPAPFHPPAPPTPAPYHYPEPQPTQQPDFFQHQVPEFPAPDNFLRNEPPPDYHSPDYYSYDHYNTDYHSPSYKSYELDTFAPGDYSDAFIDIPKLGPHSGATFSGAPGGGVGNYNQFVNVAGPESFETGHVRGNPEHNKQEFTRREGRHFKSQVRESERCTKI